MNSIPRRASVAVAAAAALALTTMAVAPAQADGTQKTVTKREARSLSRVQATTSGSSTSSTASTPVDVARVYGTDRIDTAIEASFAIWDDAGTADGNVAQAVVLTRSDEYADALGGSALAGAAGGPLLMTPSAQLRPDVEAEITRVLAEGGTVYLLGGTGALSSAIESRLKTIGFNPVRLQGADRFATSVANEVGSYLPPDGVPTFVMATTGLDFPDGLAAGATAGGYHGTVVLTRDSTVPPVVEGYLNHIRYLGNEYSKDVPFIAVGGQAAAAKITGDWDVKYAGKDRFETAALVANAFWADATTPDDDPAAIGLATGMNWPDALAGGAFMAGVGPLVLSRTDSLPTSTSGAVQALVASTDPATPVQLGVIFGGESVVSLNAENEFSTALGN